MPSLLAIIAASCAGGGVIAGAEVNRVRGQAGHVRVIETYGKDVLALFLDHAAGGLIASHAWAKPLRRSLRK